MVYGTYQFGKKKKQDLPWGLKGKRALHFAPYT